MALIPFVSCMKETSYSESFTAFATFEYLGEDYNQLFGSDSLYFSTEVSEKTFESAIGWSPLGFCSKVSPDKKTLEGGFMLSYLKPANDTVSYPANPYRVYGNPNQKNTYMVFRDNPVAGFMPAHDIFFSATSIGTCAPAGCGICNTEEVVKYVRENFEEGDRLVVKAVGYRDDAVTGTAEFALADYRTFRDSVVTKWTFFDLENLGDVDFIDFEMSSSKEGVPGYFCLDDLMARIDISY